MLSCTKAEQPVPVVRQLRPLCSSTEEESLERDTGLSELTELNGPTQALGAVQGSSVPRVQLGEQDVFCWLWMASLLLRSCLPWLSTGTLSFQWAAKGP